MVMTQHELPSENEQKTCSALSCKSRHFNMKRLHAQNIPAFFQFAFIVKKKFHYHLHASILTSALQTGLCTTHRADKRPCYANCRENPK